MLFQSFHLDKCGYFSEYVFSFAQQSMVNMECVLIMWNHALIALTYQWFVLARGRARMILPCQGLRSQPNRVAMYIAKCVCLCVRVCVRARVCVCVRARARVCVCVHSWLRSHRSTWRKESVLFQRGRAYQPVVKCAPVYFRVAYLIPRFHPDCPVSSLHMLQWRLRRLTQTVLCSRYTC